MIDDIEKNNKIYSFFSHCRERFLRRYNTELTYDVWLDWNYQIKNNHNQAVFIITTHGGEIWRVWIGSRVVFVVFKDDMVVTVMPVTNRYTKLAQKNLKIRNDKLQLTKSGVNPAQDLVESTDIFTKSDVPDNPTTNLPQSIEPNNTKHCKKISDPSTKNFKNKKLEELKKDT